MTCLRQGFGGQAATSASPRAVGEVVHYPSGRAVVMTDLGPADELARYLPEDRLVRVLCRFDGQALVRDKTRSWWVDPHLLSPTGVQHRVAGALAEAERRFAAHAGRPCDVAEPGEG